MKIHRYNSDKPQAENVFFIQSHGFHAGRPLRKPIPNSWEIETETKNAFELCYMIYNSKILKPLLRGSVIPFLSLHEYKKIIIPILENPIQQEPQTAKRLTSLFLIEQLINTKFSQIQSYQAMKTAIAHDLLQTFKRP